MHDPLGVAWDPAGGDTTLTPQLTYFGDGTWKGQFSASYDEISDLTAALKPANSAYIWAVDDGILTKVIAFNNTTAVVAGEWTITGFTGLDVECMCSFAMGGEYYIVVGDTGNNANSADSRAAGVDLRIARVKEPTVTGSNGTILAPDVEVISCAFPGANIPSHRDIECIFVDPLTGDIYFVTKRISPVLLYRLPYAVSYAGTQTLEYMGALTNDATFNTISTTPSLNNGYVVGGTMNPNGAEIVLRSYTTFYGWIRTSTTESVIEMLQRAPDSIQDELIQGRGVKRICPFGEPQGESVCFDATGQDLYHTSEKAASNNFDNPPLVLIPRVNHVLTKVSFQQGTAAYAGCTDTFIDQASAGTNNVAATSLVADYDFSPYPTITRDRQALIRFDVSTIPTNAVVVSAYLDLNIGAEGQGMDFHRMLVTWNAATVTWTSSVGGFAHNNVDAVATPSVSLGGATGEAAFLDTKTGAMRIGPLTADVQAMVTTPASNFGWVVKGRFTETTGDGMQFDSSKAVTTANRPKLIVLYYVP